MPISKKEIAEFSFDLQVGLEGADVPEYDSAKLLGMAAVLAINLRGLGEVEYRVLKLVAAKHFHIRSDVVDSVLAVLAELELIKLITTGATISSIIPDVPSFENVYEQVGDYIIQKPLNELEMTTISILARLYENPINRDSLMSKLGLRKEDFESSLQIGQDAGLIIDQTSRGRNIIASPMYFSGNIDKLIDIAARGDTSSLHKILNLVKQNQGMPLSSILSASSIGGHAISAHELELLKKLAEEGIIKPPSIQRPNRVNEQFIFTPAPGKVRMSAANREVYEKGMALAAAIRKGQLLPEAFRIRSPQAILYRLGERKWIGANSEAAHQYRNLAVLGLGRLEHITGDQFKFHLIDIPENMEAVEIAKKLLAGEFPDDL